MKAWVETKNREVRRLVHPIIEWLMWRCAEGRNEDTSSLETDMSIVTLPYQKLKGWKKLRFEEQFGKFPEAHRVSAPQINSGSAVAAAASLSVSQAEILFVRCANTAMKMNGAIVGY